MLPSRASWKTLLPTCEVGITKKCRVQSALSSEGIDKIIQSPSFQYHVKAALFSVVFVTMTNTQTTHYLIVVNIKIYCISTASCQLLVYGL